MGLSRIVTVVVLVLFFLSANQCASVAKDKSVVNDKTKFSPFYAAFSDQLKSEIKEYERLKKQLTAIHSIDWNVIAEVKAFESNSE